MIFFITIGLYACSFLLKPVHFDLSVFYIVATANFFRIFVVSVRYGYTTDERVHLLKSKKLSLY